MTLQWESLHDLKITSINLFSELIMVGNHGYLLAALKRRGHTVQKPGFVFAWGNSAGTLHFREDPFSPVSTKRSDMDQEALV